MSRSILGPDSLLGDAPRMFLGGQWVGGDDTRPVLDPSSGEVVAEVPEATSEHVEQAMTAARRAQRTWARRSLPQRAEVLEAVMAEILVHAEELAWIVVTEQGKTITEARGEVQGTRAFFDVARTHKYSPVGEMFPPMQPGEHLTVREEPLGVVVAIIPWNFPAAIFARKVAPALMAGNAVVLKPSELTPLSALAMAKVCELAGVPAGLVSVITGEGRVVGKQLVEHPATAMVTVTGSTRAGKEILAQAAASVIPVSLELGGKAPVVVFADADLDLAVRKAVEARFWNCGQVCTCNERTFVHRSIHDEFVRRTVALTEAVVVGDPAADGSQMGPKVSAEEWDKVKAMVDAAVEAGATLATGGGRPEGEQFASGYYFAPTVLTDVSPEMAVASEEVFGPVLPIIPFDSYEEVVRLANGTAYGLTAYVFTQDVTTAHRITDDLEFGEVYLNKIGPEQPQGFHTGWKMSGMGGEDGRYGYERYLRKKTVYLHYGVQEDDDPQGWTGA